MNTLYQYVQSGRVIKSYLSKLELIKDEAEYQHFLSRLKLTGYPVTLENDQVWEAKIKEINELFDSTPEQIYKLALEQDSHGYLQELNSRITPEIKRYIYNCRIIDVINIFTRNKIKLSSDLRYKIKDFLSSDLVDFMCQVCKDKDLRTYEGTVCVNGIGYLLYIIHKKEDLKKIKEAFIDLYRYYLDKVDKEGLDNRNYVYGLTHCVIDISDFYTRDVNKQIRFFQKTYPIGELYEQTAWEIGHSLREYVSYEAPLSLDLVSSDMLAELLVVYKLLLDDYPSNKYYDFGYTISRAYNELISRIDPIKGYIRDHKEKDPALDLKKNEHTNILFILYSRL